MVYQRIICICITKTKWCHLAICILSQGTTTSPGPIAWFGDPRDTIVLDALLWYLFRQIFIILKLSILFIVKKVTIENTNVPDDNTNGDDETTASGGTGGGTGGEPDLGASTGGDDGGLSTFEISTF